ncbi:MAG: hypothetical protein RIQ52_371, partial [Pseudomonadota bacterium]
HSRARVMARHLGQKVEVLWENPRQGRSTGYTPHYFRVYSDALQASSSVSSIRLSAISEAGDAFIGI